MGHTQGKKMEGTLITEQGYVWFIYKKKKNYIACCLMKWQFIGPTTLGYVCDLYNVVFQLLKPLLYNLKLVQIIGWAQRKV